MSGVYPLSWPPGRQRTPSRVREKARFGRTTSTSGFVRGMPIGLALGGLYRELERLRAKDVRISSDLPLRIDGQPRAGVRPPEDPGVAVYFKVEKEELCLSCDRYTTVGDNLRAVALSIEAIRGLERWGTKDMVRAAFRGFRALPALGETSGRSWWVILGVDPDATRAEIDEAFRQLARSRHPDVTGETGPWLELQDAHQQGKNATA